VLFHANFADPMQSISYMKNCPWLAASGATALGVDKSS
jgi:hypothetical protein